ncbi:MAG: RidA family protein [Candidatus Sumerlaeia bacterium]
MPEKISIWADGCPQAIGHYSQAIKMHDQIWISAQLPMDPATGKIVSEDFAEQVHQVFKNVQAILNAAGGQLSHIVLTRIYITQPQKLKIFDDISKEYFYFLPPARTVLPVAALPGGAAIQMEAVAVVPEIDVKGGMLF